MKTTFYLQRKNINASPPPSIAELKTEWPYLFTPREMFSHFNLLTDINILEKMEKAVEEKGKLILRFFQHKTAGTSADEVERILVKYNKEEKCDPCPCDVLTTTNWMLSIEGQVVVGPHQNIVAGMAVFFSCYYVFNLVYQEEASSTLEFIQCLKGLANASLGSTNSAQRSQSGQSRSGNVHEKRNNSVGLHVSSLLKRLMDFEWL
ncbi:uncharacterized protein LOC118320902 [Morone saxatilis]|uniref:uncharacterized protein LOC118320902 n=1 Tax=Morone saxatilis TaxID=34816 RepID=UPI0015E1EB81|nr:uncharacterized protein LOC118320902 [Morone saxatilis]